MSPAHESESSIKAELGSVKVENGYANIDWKDPDALRALTGALLKEDWKLDVDLPKDRLCPTVRPPSSQHGRNVIKMRADWGGVDS